MHEVDPDALEPSTIARDHDVPLRQIQPEMGPLRVRLRLQQRHDLVHKNLNGKVRGNERQPRIALLIDVEHVVDHAKQQLRRDLQIGHQLRRFLVKAPRAHRHQFQRFLDAGQRVPDIMRKHRGELAQRGQPLRSQQLRLQLFPLGTVAELQQEGPTLPLDVDRDHVHLHDQRGSAGGGDPNIPEHALFAALANVGEPRVEPGLIGLLQKTGHPGPDHLVRLQTQRDLRPPVHVTDDPGLVHNQFGIGRMIPEHAVVLPGSFQLLDHASGIQSGRLQPFDKAVEPGRQRGDLADLHVRAVLASLKRVRLGVLAERLNPSDHGIEWAHDVTGQPDAQVGDQPKGQDSEAGQFPHQVTERFRHLIRILADQRPPDALLHDPFRQGHGGDPHERPMPMMAVVQHVGPRRSEADQMRRLGGIGGDDQRRVRSR